MSLRPPKPVPDATPLRGTFAIVVPTGAPKRAAEDMAPSSGGEGCDVATCSDAEFNAWLDQQNPGLGWERHYNEKLMQAWMTLTTAATASTLEVAIGSLVDQGPSYHNWREAKEEAERLMQEREQAKTLLARARLLQPKISFV